MNTKQTSVIFALSMVIASIIKALNSQAQDECLFHIRNRIANVSSEEFALGADIDSQEQENVKQTLEFFLQLIQDELKSS